MWQRWRLAEGPAVSMFLGLQDVSLSGHEHVTRVGCTCEVGTHQVGQGWEPHHATMWEFNTPEVTPRKGLGVVKVNAGQVALGEVAADERQAAKLDFCVGKRSAWIGARSCTHKVNIRPHTVERPVATGGPHCTPRDSQPHSNEPFK